MLQLGGLIASFVTALIGYVIFVGSAPEDKRDGGLILLLAAVELVASLYTGNPSVALALKLLLCLQALAVVGWLVRDGQKRRYGRGVTIRQVRGQGDKRFDGEVDCFPGRESSKVAPSLCAAAIRSILPPSEALAICKLPFLGQKPV